MAADGSLKFDTKINTEGFDSGVSSLKLAIEKLTGSIDKLSCSIANTFSGAGTAASDTARKIDSVTDSAKKAEKKLSQMDQASQFTGTIERWDKTPNAPADDGIPRDVYGNDVRGAIRRNQELERSMRETGAASQEAFGEADQEVSMFGNMIDLIKRSFQTLPGMVSQFGASFSTGFMGAKADVAALVDMIDRLRDHMNQLEKQGLTFGNKDYDNTYASLKQAEAALEEYKRSLAGTDGKQKAVAASGKKMNGTLKSTKKAAQPLTKSILKLSNMFKLMLIRMAMRTVIQGVKEGFQNLAQYSEDVNKTLSDFMTCLTLLKNSFAAAFYPLTAAVMPALQNFIELISQALTYVGQFISALNGQGVYYKAVKNQEDYAASLDKTSKAAKKTTASFDDLIQIGEQKYQGVDPSDMFETIEVSNEVKDAVAKLKDILQNFFAPLKASWDQHGAAVIKSAKDAFNSLKALAGDIGTSFMQVWDKEGYGKAITDDLLITFKNFCDIIKNLADNFDKAWRSGETGTSIMRHLGDIALTITGFFREASASLREWSASLSFDALLISFDNLLVSLQPIIQKIGDIILWLLNNVLEPLASWTIEDAIPTFFNLFAAAVDVLNAMLDALQPLGIWLWESFLKPMAKWTGEIFIKALKGITDHLKAFSDWIKDHHVEIENITLAVLAFFAAWEFIKFVNGVKSMLAVLPSLILNFARMLSTLNPLYLAIAAIVAIIAVLAKNWGSMSVPEKVISGVLALLSAVGMLAVAFHALQGAVAVGVLSAALVAGIGAVTIAINAGKRSAATSGSYSGYNMPRFATGGVVPPNAGEHAVIVGDNRYESEVISPVSKIKQAVSEVMDERGGGKTEVILKFNGTLAGLARELKPALENENNRIGVRLVTEG